MSPEPDKDQVRNEITHIYQTVTDRRYTSYSLVRYYHRPGAEPQDVFRVTVARESVDYLCCAYAEVLDAHRAWTQIVTDPAENWFSTTSPHPDRGTGDLTESGLVSLGRIADTLAATAMTIVPANSPSKPADTSDLVIRTFLDLSTAHLGETTCRDLNSYEGVLAYETGHGWLMYVPQDAADRARDGDWPAELLASVTLAQANDCAYLLFDADAETTELLPVFDWS